MSSTFSCSIMYQLTIQEKKQENSITWHKKGICRQFPSPIKMHNINSSNMACLLWFFGGERGKGGLQLFLVIFYSYVCEEREIEPLWILMIIGGWEGMMENSSWLYVNRNFMEGNFDTHEFDGCWGFLKIKQGR